MKALIGPCESIKGGGENKGKRCGNAGELVRISGCTLSVTQYTCPMHQRVIAAEGLSVSRLSQVEAECVDTAQGG